MNGVTMTTEEKTNTQSNGNAITPIERQALAATPTNLGIASPYSSESAFAAGWRMAKSLAASTLVPEAYRNKPENCLIALELASRIGVSVMATMQNLHIIQGRPSWSATFLIATVNASGRFTPLRYEWAGKEGTDAWACRAVAKDRVTGELLEGTWITWMMAKKEGWTSKKGSKWMTMAQQMFVYRAASFWSRMYCPEISIGFQTTEEVMDVQGYTVPETQLPAEISPAGAKALEGLLGLQSDAPQLVAETQPIDATQAGALFPEREVVEPKQQPRSKQPVGRVASKGDAPSFPGDPSAEEQEEIARQLALEAEAQR